MHPEVDTVRWIQARESDSSAAVHIDVSSDDDEDPVSMPHHVGEPDKEEEDGEDADNSSNGSSSDDESPVQAANKFAALGVVDD